MRTTAVQVCLALLVSGCPPSGLGNSDSGSSASDTSGPSPKPTTDSEPTTTTGFSDSEGGPSSGTTFDCRDDGTAGDCSVWCQNCTEGQKCAAFGPAGEEIWNQAECKPIPNRPKATGEPCAVAGDSNSGDDDCDKGTACFGFPLSIPPQCYALCKGNPLNPSCADPNTRCANIAGLPLCVPICSPLGLQTCPKACLPTQWNCADCFPMTELDTFMCQEHSEGEPYGQPCLAHAMCENSMFCSPPGRVPGCASDSRCCTPYCDLDAPTCPPGTVCNEVFGPGAAPDTLKNLGICLSPG